METSDRTNRPDRLEIFSNDWDDPDDHVETRLNVNQNKAKQQEKTR